MPDIALEIPLPPLLVRGLVQGDHAGGAGVQVFVEPLAGAALARRVAPFEQDHEFLAGVLRPDLDLQQFGLQQRLFGLVLAAAHASSIGIASGLESLAHGIGIRRRPGSAGRPLRGDRSIFGGFLGGRGNRVCLDLGFGRFAAGKKVIGHGSSFRKASWRDVTILSRMPIARLAQDQIIVLSGDLLLT